MKQIPRAVSGNRIRLLARLVINGFAQAAATIANALLVELAFDKLITADLAHVCSAIESLLKAKLAVQFCPVELRTPEGLDHRDPLKVYAVSATKVDCSDVLDAAKYGIYSRIEIAATILPP